MIKMELPEKIPFDASLPVVADLMDQVLLQSDEPISDIMRHLTTAKGKNFRARLLLAGAADGNGFVSRDALITAAALEMLHLATLVHDDVIDDAEMRRGQLSVQRRFDKKSAVICGDYLFCKCFLMMSEISEKYQNRFMDIAKMMTRICLGELRQYQHNRDTSLSVHGYLRIIAGKTSALFSLSLYAGAVLGGYAEKEARQLALLGYYIGVIFQLKDDCIDYQSDAATARKNVQHDLAEGVVTLPLIFAIAQKPQIRDELRNFDLSASEYQSIISEVCSLGGVDKTAAVADRYYEKALKVLDRLADENKRALLHPILDTIKLREY